MGYSVSKSLKKLGVSNDMQKVANVATFGQLGAANGILSGDIKGGITSAATLGTMGNTGAAKGLSSMSGTQVNPADPNGYLKASNDLLNPVADQFSQLGQTSITSNVDPAFRQYQLGLAQQLQQQANGQGPSLAQMQLQQATDRTLNQSIGAIRAATGPNAALTGRTAALASAQQMGAAGNASGQLRLNEQQQAQAALAGLANQGRTGDLSTNAQNIQAQQAQAQARLEAAQGLQGVRNTQLGAQGNVLGYQNAADIATANNKNARTGQIIGGVMGGLSTLGAAAMGPAGLMGAAAPAAAGTAAPLAGNQGVKTQAPSPYVDNFGNPVS